MERIRLIGRSSPLSLLQVDRVKKKIEAVYPGIAVEILTRSSRGDDLQGVPLHAVEGSDFFTKDIFDALSDNEADIAIHSLKDMSAEHFFGSNHFAVVERDDVRDVAIFRKGVRTKISRGKEIVIGTCSPRREEMATGFLTRALPQSDIPVRITTKPIRGNVDTRLSKLDEGAYDGIILATAGINRLLNSEIDKKVMGKLLEDKLLMILPLVECVPAPCQGAIVAEAYHQNAFAVEVINAINDQFLMEDCVREKQIAMRYGTGCLQRFGVTTLQYDGKKSQFAAGTNTAGKNFSDWYHLPPMEIGGKMLFSTIEFMGSFFNYDFNWGELSITEPVVYVSNYKAIQDLNSQVLQTKKVWTAGTKTWVELAKKGIWVEGCADALGLESLKTAFVMPLLDIKINDVCILTNEQSVTTWQRKGWKAVSTYTLESKENKLLKEQLRNADIIFWTSYRQYEQSSELLKKGVRHACPAGETAWLLRQDGVEPIVFPTIKSFQQWRSSFSQSHNVA